MRTEKRGLEKKVGVFPMYLYRKGRYVDRPRKETKLQDITVDKEDDGENAGENAGGAGQKTLYGSSS